MNAEPLAHGRASAKLILLGEHAVVHGAPALAAGMERGARATAAPAGVREIDLGPQHAREGDGSDTSKAYAGLLDTLGAGAMHCQVELEVPAGVGLGASAAIAVAIARAVLAALEPTTEPESADRRTRVLRAAAAWEGVFHGNPSGVDTAAAAHGGCIRFVRGAPIKPVHVAKPLPLAVAVAGPPASTKGMVSLVAQQRERDPSKFDQALSAIESLVNNAQGCIERGELRELGQLFDLNQMLLSGWLVSTESIERARAIAHDAGALGSKLTGAGGGGCVLALAEENTGPIVEAWQRSGLRSFGTVVGSDEFL